MSVFICKDNQYHLIAGNKVYYNSEWIELSGEDKIQINGVWYPLNGEITSSSSGTPIPSSSSSSETPSISSSSSSESPSISSSSSSEIPSASSSSSSGDDWINVVRVEDDYFSEDGIEGEHYYYFDGFAKVKWNDDKGKYVGQIADELIEEGWNYYIEPDKGLDSKLGYWTYSIGSRNNDRKFAYIVLGQELENVEVER